MDPRVITEISVAFSQLLRVRIIKDIKVTAPDYYMTTFELEDVSSDIKQQFAKELEISICRMLEVTDVILYANEYGENFPLGEIMPNMTDPLGVLVCSLPQLPWGKLYAFPFGTFLEIAVENRTANSMEVSLSLSSNISNNL